LMPLRMEDTGGLGLMRDWIGEGPTAMAARERLGEQAPPGSSSASIEEALKLALKVRPPQKHPLPPGGANVIGPVPWVLPFPRSWRVHHADAVRRCFLTPARTRANTKEEFAEVLLNDAGTRRMIPNAKSKKPMKFDMRIFKDTVRSAPEKAKEKLLALASIIRKMSKEDLVALLESLGVRPQAALVKHEAFELAEMAAEVLQGELSVIPVPEKDYEEHIRRLTNAELEELWRDTARPGLGALLGEELAQAVDEELRQESTEDGKIEGSAGDELQLAMEISSLLCQLGVWPTATDLRALCAAAHAAGESELAAELLRALSDELQSTFAEEEEEEESDAEMVPHGPASEALADAMAQGGWEHGSCQDFLAGRRQLPQRAGGEGLGGLLTRYLDPLLGQARGDPARRAELFSQLQEPLLEQTPAEVAEQVVRDRVEEERKAKAVAEKKRLKLAQDTGVEHYGDGDVYVAKEGLRDDAAEQAEEKEEEAPWKVDLGATDADTVALRIKMDMNQARTGGRRWALVTETEVLSTLLLRPMEADAVLLPTSPKPTSYRKMIRRLRGLGLPAPNLKSEVERMYRFVKSVWAEASARRRALAEVLEGTL